jgi:hypothetical protein
MPTRDEIILDLIRRAKPMPIWERFLYATRPRQRSCRFCGAEYVGYRDICGSPVCLQAWQRWLQEHERRYPSMPSMGAAFYLDYLARHRDEG